MTAQYTSRAQFFKRYILYTYIHIYRCSDHIYMTACERFPAQVSVKRLSSTSSPPPFQCLVSVCWVWTPIVIDLYTAPFIGLGLIISTWYPDKLQRSWCLAPLPLHHLHFSRVLWLCSGHESLSTKTCWGGTDFVTLIHEKKLFWVL